METLPKYIQNIIDGHNKDIREILQKVRTTDAPQTVPGTGGKIVIAPLPDKKPNG